MVDDENIDPYASKDRNDSAKPETAPDAPSAEAELASIDNADEEEDEVADLAATSTVDDELAISRVSTAKERGIELVDTPYYMNVRSATPIVSTFKDHFSLNVPTSRIRYRASGAAACVIENEDSQFIIEETRDEATGEQSVTLRRIHDTSEGVRLLRLTYVVVAAFWTGFLFVFCLQVLLFLALDLAVAVGATSQQQTVDPAATLGCILSFPLYVYSLATALVMAGAFILDTWRGHLLVRNFTLRKLKVVTVEWLFFSFFLGMPIFVMACTLMIYENWWVITGLFWFSCIVLFYFMFTGSVVYFELTACWDLIQKLNNEKDASFWKILGSCIMMRQLTSYSGRKHISFLSLGTFSNSEETDKAGEENIIEETRHESISLLAKFTQLEFLTKWGLYERLSPEERVYPIEDARDVRPFVTSHSWSLEKIFCRPRNSRYVAIVRGPGALTRAQIKSSMICSVLGTFLIMFLMIGVLVYLQVNGIEAAFVIAIVVIIAYPPLSSAFRLYRSGVKFISLRSSEKKVIQGPGNDIMNAVRPLSELGRSAVGSESTFVDGPDFCFNATESHGVYLVEQTYRITKPSQRFCWAMFGIEVILLFVYPMSALFASKNYSLATFFLVIGMISGLRFYVNASLVLEETGSMDLIIGKSERDTWRKQSRLDDIIGNITRGRSRRAWTAVLGIFGFIFLGLYLGAISTGTVSTFDKPYTYLNDFEYIRVEESMQYPSCRLASDLANSPLNSMAGKW